VFNLKARHATPYIYSPSIAYAYARVIAKTTQDIMAKKKLRENKEKQVGDAARVAGPIYRYTYGMLETLTPSLGPISLSYTIIPRGYPSGSYLEY